MFIEANGNLQIRPSIKPKVGIIMFTLGAALITAAIFKLYIGSALLKIFSSYKIWAVLSLVSMNDPPLCLWNCLLGVYGDYDIGIYVGTVRGAPYTVYDQKGAQYFVHGIARA